MFEVKNWVLLLVPVGTPSGALLSALFRGDVSPPKPRAVYVSGVPTSEEIQEILPMFSWRKTS